MKNDNVCPDCGVIDHGQHGEFPYNVCETPQACKDGECEPGILQPDTESLDPSGE